MFHHMVMFRFPDAATADEVVAKLHELAEEIDEVAGLKAGRDVIGDTRSFDVGMLMTFDDAEAFQRYNAHPKHVPVAAWIDGAATDVAAVDWED